MNTHMPFEPIEEIINLQETPLANSWKEIVSIVEQGFQILNKGGSTEPRLKKESWVRFTVRKEAFPAVYLTALLDLDSNSINVTLTNAELIIVNNTPTKRLSTEKIIVFHFELERGKKPWLTSGGESLRPQEVANYILQAFVEGSR